MLQLAIELGHHLLVPLPGQRGLTAVLIGWTIYLWLDLDQLSSLSSWNPSSIWQQLAHQGECKSWTLDWTMDWTMDWNMDSILDSFSSF